MERDRDSLKDELAGEHYYASVDARHDAEPEEDEAEESWYRARTLATWARERGDHEDARFWETREQILAHTARIRQARAEMAAEFAALDAAELKEAA